MTARVDRDREIDVRYLTAEAYTDTNRFKAKKSR